MFAYSWKSQARAPHAPRICDARSVACDCDCRLLSPPLPRDHDDVDDEDDDPMPLVSPESAGQRMSCCVDVGGERCSRLARGAGQRALARPPALPTCPPRASKALLQRASLLAFPRAFPAVPPRDGGGSRCGMAVVGVAGGHASCASSCLPSPAAAPNGLPRVCTHCTPARLLRVRCYKCRAQRTNLCSVSLVRRLLARCRVRRRQMWHLGAVALRVTATPRLRRCTHASTGE